MFVTSIGSFRLIEAAIGGLFLGWCALLLLFCAGSRIVWQFILISVMQFLMSGATFLFVLPCCFRFCYVAEVKENFILWEGSSLVHLFGIRFLMYTGRFCVGGVPHISGTLYLFPIK